MWTRLCSRLADTSLCVQSAASTSRSAPSAESGLHRAGCTTAETCINECLAFGEVNILQIVACTISQRQEFMFCWGDCIQECSRCSSQLLSTGQIDLMSKHGNSLNKLAGYSKHISEVLDSRTD